MHTGASIQHGQPDKSCLVSHIVAKTPFCDAVYMTGSITALLDLQVEQEEEYLVNNLQRRLAKVRRFLHCLLLQQIFLTEIFSAGQ